MNAEFGMGNAERLECGSGNGERLECGIGNVEGGKENGLIVGFS